MGIFVKKSLCATQTELSILCKDCEDLWLELELANHTKLIFGVIYRHPRNNISEYQSNLCALLNDFNTYKKSYYICGDINLDLLKHDTVPKIRNYAESLNYLGCVPVLCYPTRVTSSTATLIDHVYTNDLKNNVKCFILKHDSSDHWPILFTVAKNALKSPPSKSFTRDTRNFILENFLLDLQQAFDVHKFNPRNNLLHDSVNQKFTAFIDIFQNTLNQWFSNLSEVSNPTDVMQAYIEPLIIIRSGSRKFWRGVQF